MEADSFFDEMEPRMLRPVLPFFDRQQMVFDRVQVSEPSLFQEDGASPFLRRDTAPRMQARQISPIKNPVFCRSLDETPRVVRQSKQQSPCSCKAGGCSSPLVDPEIKELIQDQNKQLQLLRSQVQSLLSYQEQLQRKSSSDPPAENRHEGTQTTMHESPRSPFNIFQAQTPPLVRSERSPSGRPFSDRNEMTLTFRDMHLETIFEQAPSPQPSFTVSMHEYQESVSDKNDDSVSGSCVSVMEHVQRLLAQAPAADDDDDGPRAPQRNQHRLLETPELEQHTSDNLVRKVTMQRIQELGVSFLAPGTNLRGNSVYRAPTFGMTHQHDMRKETDQSVEMQRLAEKYLGQKDGFMRASRRAVEVSLSTQQYLRRYGLAEDVYSSNR